MGRARDRASADLNGQEFILDADADTSISADTDDQIDIKIAGADDFAFKANTFEVQTGSNIDMNGTELILDADGDTSITADTDDTIDVKVGGSDKIRIDSSGRLLMGATTAESFAPSTTPQVQIEGTDHHTSSAAIIRNSNDNGQALLILGKSRGTSVGADTVVQDGDNVGEVLFTAADGSDRTPQVASVRAAVDGTPGSNDMPGRLVFSTTADGSQTISERMRIDSSGNVGIGTTSPSDHLQVKGFFQVEGKAGDGNYIRFDNSANSGNIWRIGPGVYSHTTFSIYNQTDNSNVVNIESVNDQLMFRSMTQVSLADDATAIAVANSFQGIVVVTSSSNALTGIYRCEGQNNPTLISGTSNFTNTDTDGKFCLISASSSNNVTFRNRFGATYSFKIASFGVLS